MLNAQLIDSLLYCSLLHLSHMFQRQRVILSGVETCGRDVIKYSIINCQLSGHLFVHYIHSKSCTVQRLK